MNSSTCWVYKQCTQPAEEPQPAATFFKQRRNQAPALQGLFRYQNPERKLQDRSTTKRLGFNLGVPIQISTLAEAWFHVHFPISISYTPVWTLPQHVLSVHVGCTFLFHAQVIQHLTGSVKINRSITHKELPIRNTVEHCCLPQTFELISHQVKELEKLSY